MQPIKKGASRVSVVTGAAGTVGGAVVQHLQNNGWIVAGIDLSKAGADMNLQVDVTDRSAMLQAAREIGQAFGCPQLLVTAAATYEDAPFGDLSLERWKALLAVHLGGTTNACAAFVPAMTTGAGGCVITLAPDLSRVGGLQTYNAAATGTIRAFSKSLATEVAPCGVRVNCLAPREPGDSGAIAQTITFLADEGTFYTGQVISVCPAGGSVAGGSA